MIVRACECGGGGDLIARRKRKSSLLRPLPLFLGSRSQKGGITAGQYGIIIILILFWSICINSAHDVMAPLRYDTILACWKMDSTERPTFSQLVVSLSGILDQLAGYFDLKGEN